MYRDVGCERTDLGVRLCNEGNIFRLVVFWSNVTVFYKTTKKLSNELANLFKMSLILNFLSCYVRTKKYFPIISTSSQSCLYLIGY